METHSIRLHFGSFVKTVVLAMVSATMLGAPINVFFAFQESGDLQASLYYLLGPVAGVVLGVLVGILGYPLYRLATKRFPQLARVNVDEIHGPRDEPSELAL